MIELTRLQALAEGAEKKTTKEELVAELKKRGWKTTNHDDGDEYDDIDVVHTRADFLRDKFSMQLNDQEKFFGVALSRGSKNRIRQFSKAHQTAAEIAGEIDEDCTEVKTWR